MYRKLGQAQGRKWGRGYWALITGLGHTLKLVLGV